MIHLKVTTIGAAVLLATLFLLLFQRRRLFGLLFLAAALQGPSVLNFDWRGVSYGISPFMAVASLIALDALRKLSGAPDGVLIFNQIRAAALWPAFAAVVVLTVLVGPLLFAGLPVLTPLAKGGVQSEGVALAWTVNHLAQLVNWAFLVAAGAWLWTHGRDSRLPQSLLVAAMIAAALAIVIGLQQRLAWNGLVPMWAETWASNPTYAQDYDSLAGAVPRVSWPFVDPSYASAFFAAMFGGFLTMFLAGQRTNAALLGLMVSLFALGNTLGATGSLAVIVVVVLAAAAVLVVAVRRPMLAGALAYRILLLSLAAGCVALGGFLVLRHYDLLGVFGEAMRNVLAGRSQTFLGDIRPHADLMSLKLLVETWGLGVGMGSHRGSSYLITLAANTGVLGLVTFFAANVMHFTLLTKRFIRHPDAPSAFFLGSGISVLIAVSIAIPDQNWPVYWILILGGFACIICPVEGEKAKDASREVAAESPDQPASRTG